MVSSDDWLNSAARLLAGWPPAHRLQSPPPKQPCPLEHLPINVKGSTDRRLFACGGASLFLPSSSDKSAFTSPYHAWKQRPPFVAMDSRSPSIACIGIIGRSVNLVISLVVACQTNSCLRTILFTSLFSPRLARDSRLSETSWSIRLCSTLVLTYSRLACPRRQSAMILDFCTL